MPRLRRPTIPICDWRIAVHLEETKGVQGQHGTPAFECDCDECTRWRNRWRDVLPEALSSELSRLGVDPARPTDIYGGDAPRVSYHVVGKIISGPDSFRQDKQWGRQQTYQVIREDPWLGISVARSEETSAAEPVIDENAAGDLIVIDLRTDWPRMDSRT